MLNPLMRKVAHFTEFAALGVCTVWMILGLRISEKLWTKASAALGYCVMVAALDETLQLFVEGRHGSMGDVMLDSSGAIVGIMLVILVVHFRNGKNRQIG